MGWNEVVALIRKGIKKLISAGGTIALTVGGYTFIVFFSESTGLRIPDATFNTLIQALVALGVGYGLWTNGALPVLKTAYQTAIGKNTTEVNAMYDEIDLGEEGDEYALI